MNICLVSREYPPGIGLGGIGTFAYNLAHGFANMGHTVHVIAEGQNIEKNYLDKKVNVHRIIPKRLKGLWRVEKYLPAAIIMESYYVAKKIKELSKVHKFDIIEFQNRRANGFWFLLNKIKIPVVTRMHTPLFEVMRIEKSRNTLKKRIICWMEKIACSRSDLLFCSTNFHCNMMKSAYRMQRREIKIIPLGIESINYKEKLPTKDKIIKKVTLNVLYVSRLEERKGTKVLLNAIPEIINDYEKVNFFIIGKDYKNRYQNWFLEKFNDEKYFSRVHFLGYVEKNKLEQYYQDCDVFVVPSLYESFGLIYLEAMRYGKPIVSCYGGGIPEVVENGKTGILVPPNDTKALTKAVLSLFNNVDVRYEMSTNSLIAFNSKFTSGKMAANTVKAYSELIPLQGNKGQTL